MVNGNVSPDAQTALWKWVCGPFEQEPAADRTRSSNPSSTHGRATGAGLSPSSAKRASGGRILRPARAQSYADRLQARDARLPAPAIAASGS